MLARLAPLESPSPLRAARWADRDRKAVPKDYQYRICVGIFRLYRHRPAPRTLPSRYAPRIS